jgi:hypothetical protein
MAAAVFFFTGPGIFRRIKYNDNNYWLKTLDKLKPYYFSIEAINENGVSSKARILRIE